MNKSVFYISLGNDKNKLHCVLWEPEKEAKAVLQISHGMVEYIERYDHFAQYLTDAGIVVVGNDHRGHGMTACSEEDFGYFAENEPSKTAVEDLHRVTAKIKEKYKDLPYFVMGHSMGSFLIRRYLMTYGNEADGVIIMGTGAQPTAVLMAGKCIIRLLKTVKGERYRSALFDKMCFGSYNKRIQSPRTDKDWISRNADNVDSYLADPYCSFLFTLNGFETLFSTISFVQAKRNIGKIPKKLPVYMVAGKEDPVGNYGKGVRKVYETYKKHGIQDIEIKLYENDRHEILNETDYEIVYQDILSWIEKKVHNMK